MRVNETDVKQTARQQPTDYCLNMDFSQVALSKPDSHTWVSSPADGVERIHLERVAAESGHTTSFVRFAPGSHFAAHTHHQGEEIYVMEGVFSDEQGDYPAGSYIRNPPGSRHRPFTETGCTLFVKLEQFQAGDDARVIIRPEDQQWRPGIGNLRVCGLHDFAGEHTALVYWPENEVFQQHSHFGGEEIVVLAGEFIDEHGGYPAGSWIRSPHMSVHFPYVKQATLILVKVGHVPF